MSELWNRAMANTVGRLSLDPLGLHAERILRGLLVRIAGDCRRFWGFQVLENLSA